MQQTQKKLMSLFWGILAVAALVVLLFETDTLLAGSVTAPMNLFVMATTMQLLTIAALPAALYLFRIPRVHQALTADPLESPRRLSFWATLRLAMLGLPLLLNVVFYYLCGHDVRYFYLFVILLIGLFFVYPTLKRCEGECAKEDDNTVQP